MKGVERQGRKRKRENWLGMFHMLQAYRQEPGADVNDFCSALNRCPQTKDFGSHFVDVDDNQTTYKRLGCWCKNQRQAYKNEAAIKTTGKNRKGMQRISSEQIRKLESIGFQWDLNAYQWTKMFDMLNTYCQEFGADVNDGYRKMGRCLKKIAGNEKDTTYKRLGIWCKNQRSAYQNEMSILFFGKKINNMRISCTQIKQLELIGFKFKKK